LIVKPIRALCPTPRHHTITWRNLPAEDVIFLCASLRGLHRDHVQCHELGHLLAGHLQTAAGYTPGGDSGLAGAAEWMLPRQCDYGSAHEREAEHIAELILARVRQAIPGVRGRANPRTVSGFGSALR
jgi:hypothetical protein